MPTLSRQDIIAAARHTKELLKESSFVYFLVNDNDVVYVGSSRSGFSRLWAHLEIMKRGGSGIYAQPKPFTSCHYIVCPPEDRLEIEADYIIKLNPVYNKTVPRSQKYIQFAEAMTIHKLKISSVKAICAAYNLPVFRGTHTLRAEFNKVAPKWRRKHGAHILAAVEPIHRARHGTPHV